MTDSKQNIVFISGFMLDESLWDQVTPYFQDSFNLYTISLKHGQTIEEISQHIVKNLPEHFILVGFSLGGYITRFIASRFPEKVSALILIASSLRCDTQLQVEQKRQAIQANTVENFRGLSQLAIKKSLHPQHQHNKERIQHIQSMGAGLGYRCFVNLSLLDRNIDHAQHPIMCPMLVIYGLQDALRSKQEAIELTSLTSLSALISIEETGHMIPLEQPNTLANTILDWLQQYHINISVLP